MRAPLILPALLALAGCVIPIPIPLPEGAVPEGTPFTFRVTLDEGDPCGARDLRSLVGQPAPTDGTLRLVRADGTPVAARVLRAGQSVPASEQVGTDPTRINVFAGPDGRVASVSCG